VAERHVGLIPNRRTFATSMPVSLAALLYLRYTRFQWLPSWRQAYGQQKKRLTLDLDPPLQRRLKAVTALKGISMRQYCQAAIEKELTKDEAQGLTALPFGKEALDRLEALQSKIFQGRTLPSDSAELIREARASWMSF
jgi:hypothetical protein